MKKLFSVLILTAMLACMLPMIAVSAAIEGDVPIAKAADGTVLSGAATEPHLKSWTITDTELYLDAGKDQGYFIFDGTMKEGRLAGTIVTNAQSNSCNGIVFGLTDGDNLNFWESGVSFYWLFVDEGNRLRLSRVGDGANYSTGTWHDLIQQNQVDLDDMDLDVTKGVTLAAEWDGKGNIKCYVNDELIYTVDDTESPFTGSRFGVRMKEKAVSGAAFTAIVAGYPDEPATGESTTDAPVTGESTTDAPVTDESTTDAPVTDESTTDAPVTGESTTDAPVTGESTTDAPVTGESTTDAPVTDESTTDAPVTDESTTDAPVTDESTTDAPTDQTTTDGDSDGDADDGEEAEDSILIPVVIAAAVVIAVVLVVVIVKKKR